jgi:hypothetical protein
MKHTDVNAFGGLAPALKLRLNPCFRELSFVLVFTATLLLSLNGCGDLRNMDRDQQAAASEEEETIPCARVAQLGDLEVCLPEFENFQECKDHPIIDSLLHQLVGPERLTLGYYLNDSDYAAIDSLRGLALRDYAIFYGTQLALNMRFTERDLEDVAAEMSGGQVEERWEAAKQKLNDHRDDTEFGRIKFGLLVLLEKYTPAPDVRFNVLLMESVSGDVDQLTMVIMGVIRLHERAIFMGFYFPVTDDTSLETGKNKAERLVKAFVKANP